MSSSPSIQRKDLSPDSPGCLPPGWDKGSAPPSPGQFYLNQLLLQLQGSSLELHQCSLLTGRRCLQLSFQTLLQTQVPTRRNLNTQPFLLCPYLPPATVPTSDAGSPLLEGTSGAPRLPVPAPAADAPAGPSVPGPVPQPSLAPVGRQNRLSRWVEDGSTPLPQRQRKARDRAKKGLSCSLPRPVTLANVSVFPSVMHPWFTSVTPALKKLRLEDGCQVKASLGCISSL